PLRADAARVRLRAHVHVPASGDGSGAGGDHVPDAAGGDGLLLPRAARRGGDGVNGRRLGRAAGLYGAGSVLLLLGAFPLFWMLSTALKPSGEIFATPTLVRSHAPRGDFVQLLTEYYFSF